MRSTPLFVLEMNVHPVPLLAKIWPREAILKVKQMARSGEVKISSNN